MWFRVDPKRYCYVSQFGKWRWKCVHPVLIQARLEGGCQIVHKMKNSIWLKQINYIISLFLNNDGMYDHRTHKRYKKCIRNGLHAVFTRNQPEHLYKQTCIIKLQNKKRLYFSHRICFGETPLTFDHIKYIIKILEFPKFIFGVRWYTPKHSKLYCFCNFNDIF